MLSLKDKLKPYNKQQPTPSPAGNNGLPGFYEVSNDYGTCLRREIPMRRQGNLIGADPAWALLAHNSLMGDFDPGEAVYLDLETNGLYLGAGAFAFLIGLGLVRMGEPYLVQFFLRDPRDERAALADAYDLLNGHALVTYNGKCFDWPLLSDRYRLHRLPVPVIGHHLDMLHPARRLYRNDLSRCGLKEIENHVLGIKREGDIDGALIPAAYSRYLREGYTEEISTIVKHNVIDINSLFNLTLYCGEVYRHCSNCQREGELMAVVKSCLQAGEYSQACDYLQMMIEQQGRQLPEAHYLLGMVHKRWQDWSLALYNWEMAVVKSKFATAPLIEMAKYYEHQERDFVQAHALTYQALQNALALRKSAEIKECTHRLSRLQNKLETTAKEAK